MLCEEDTKEYTSTCGSKEGVQDGKWFAARLADAGLSEDFAVEHMCISRGSEALPSAEQQAQYDVLVLGGTFHNVYDGREWQVPLRQWLVDQRETGRPLLGICGGHQAMCTALGGSVVKRTNGTAAGTFPVALTSDGATHELFKVTRTRVCMCMCVCTTRTTTPYSHTNTTTLPLLMHMHHCHCHCHRHRHHYRHNHHHHHCHLSGYGRSPEAPGVPVCQWGPPRRRQPAAVRDCARHAPRQRRAVCGLGPRLDQHAGILLYTNTNTTSGSTSVLYSFVGFMPSPSSTPHLQPSILQMRSDPNLPPSPSSLKYHPEAHHDTFHNWVSTGVIVPAPAPADAYRESASGSALIANFLAAC